MSYQTIIPPSSDGFSRSLRDPVPAAITARFFAMVIDRLIVGAILFVIFIPLGVITTAVSLLAVPQLMIVNATIAPSLAVLAIMFDWLYYALMESSERGGTFGKRLMGVRVVNEERQRISFFRATMRYLMKIISAMPMMLGYVMAFFTAKKQALHDMLAGTYVVEA